MLYILILAVYSSKQCWCKVSPFDICWRPEGIIKKKKNRNGRASMKICSQFKGWNSLIFYSVYTVVQIYFRKWLPFHMHPYRSLIPSLHPQINNKKLKCKYTIYYTLTWKKWLISFKYLQNKQTHYLFNKLFSIFCLIYYVLYTVLTYRDQFIFLINNPWEPE